MLELIFEFYATLAIPLIYLSGLIVISLSLSTLHYTPSTLPGLAITTSGLILWIATYLALRSSLSVLPKAQTLITTGPYQYFSHPMYVAITLTFFGLSLATGSIPGVLYTILIVIPLNFLRAKTEEKELFKKFGKKYEEYKKKVLL